LAALDAVGQLDAATICRALADQDNRVRRFAAQLAAAHAQQPGPVRDALLAAVDTADAGVRFQVALALTDWHDPRKLDALAELARSGADDPLVATALAGSLGSSSAELVARLLENENDWRHRPTPTQLNFLRQAAAVGAASPELAAALRRTCKNGAPGPGDLAVFVGLQLPAAGQAVARGPSPGREKLRALAAALAADAGRPLEQRLVAVEAMPLLDKQAGPLLVALLDAQHDARLQQAAARALVNADEPSARAMLAAWPGLPTATRRAVIASALRWPAGVEALLSALEDDHISLQELDPAVRDALAALPDAQLKERAQKLIAELPPPVDRQAVLARYEPELARQGDRARGATLFEKHCLTCHMVQGRGQRVGPDLSGIGARPKETLLVDILDPNRQIAADFVAYTLITRGGQVLGGLLAAESAGSITLRRAEGAQDVVAREDIEEFRSTGKSLMPEGLENQLAPRDLADLLAFLAQPDATLFSPAK
jgi:putative heme-binding domain-containing protein